MRLIVFFVACDQAGKKINTRRSWYCIMFLQKTKSVYAVSGNKLLEVKFKYLGVLFERVRSRSLIPGLAKQM